MYEQVLCHLTALVQCPQDMTCQFASASVGERISLNARLDAPPSKMESGSQQGRNIQEVSSGFRGLLQATAGETPLLKVLLSKFFT